MQEQLTSIDPAGEAPERTIMAYAPAFFGLLATRLTELIVDEGGQIAASRGIETPARCMSTILILLDGEKGVSELARELGLSHVALIKIVRQLNALGFVETGADPNDRRRRPIKLTKKGLKAARDVESFIAHLQLVYLELFEEIGVNVHDALRKMEAALRTRSLYDRLDAKVPDQI